MTTTPILYARIAEPQRYGGQALRWNNPDAAAGAPNGTVAVDFDATRGGVQQLRLSGHEPQANILASTGGVIPFAVDRVQVQVAFTIGDNASNYPDVRVMLGNPASGLFATAQLDVRDGGSGRGVVTAAVEFPDRTGFSGAPLVWRDLAGLYVVVQVGRSGAAGPDTFGIDAVGLVVTYTAAQPQGLATLVPAAASVVTLRVYDRNGARLGTLPWSSLTRSVVRNGLGSLTATVPRSLTGGGLLDVGERWLRVVEDGVEAPDWYVLDDDGDDDADEGGSVRPVSIGATSAAQMLDWGTVYSWEYNPSNGRLLGLDPTHGFAAATPGEILSTFIDLAQGRGCFPQLDYSFTDAHDSAGRAWPRVYARVYDIGTTVLAVLTAMAEDAWVDWEMVGNRLDLYVPDTVLAADYPNVVLRLGQSVTSGPRKRSRKDARSTLLANGAEGATVEIVDPGAVQLWGRREGYEGRSGVTDVGTLTATSQVSLARRTTASESITLALAPDAVPDLFLPRPGGYIRYDQRRLSPTLLEPMRLQSIAWDYGDDAKVSVELNDLWVDGDVKRGRQIDALLGGSSANERVPVKPAGDDRIPPGQVQGLSLVSAAYLGPGGQPSAQVTATWLELKLDSDGTMIDDLVGYDIQWRQTDVASSVFDIRTAVVTSYQWSPVVPNTSLDARIRGVDRYGNPGAWSPWVTVTTGKDQTAPAQPTPPVVDNVLGLLRVFWDGKLVGGAALPADFSRVEIHTSTLDGFDPNESPDATRVGILSRSSYGFLDVPYGLLQHIRLVAVDNTGNRSQPSTQVQGTSSALLSDDIFDGAIGESKLANLTVTTAKIKELDLNNGRVGNLSVGKLTAGVMTANVIVGNRLATGNRGLGVPVVELTGDGIYRWNAADEQTVAIDADGALLTGMYRTAVTGRRIEMGASGRVGRIDFFSPGSFHGFILSWTQNGTDSVEAIQFGMQVPGVSSTLWNRINYNASPLGEYATYRSGVHEFMFDAGNSQVTGGFSVFQGVNRDGPGNYARVQITNSGHQNFLPAGFWNYGVRGRRSDGGNFGLHTIDNGTQTFRAGDTVGRLEIVGGGGYNSPLIRFFNDINGGALKFYWTGSDTPRIEARWWDDSGFITLAAAGFAVNSDKAVKEQITAVDGASLLADVRSVGVHSYRRKRTAAVPEGSRADAPRNTRAPVEVGLIAQDAPERLRGVASDGTLTLDLYQLAATTWGAVAHLAGQFDELAAQMAAMTEEEPKRA